MNIVISDEEHDVDTVKGWKTNILKDPRKEVTILEAQQEDFQGPCGVHIEEITHLKDMQEWLVVQVNKHQIWMHLILFESFILFP